MKINFNPDVIIKNREQANGRNLEIFAQIILDDSNFYIPRDQDILHSSGHAEGTAEGGATVSWRGPYARYLYYGEVMVGRESRSAWAKSGETKVTTGSPIRYGKDKNPHAQKEWFKAAKKAKQGWAKQAGKLFGGG